MLVTVGISVRAYRPTVFS